MRYPGCPPSLLVPVNGVRLTSLHPMLIHSLAALACLLLAGPLQAAHSDIIISRSNGVLRVDSTIHTGNVRENDAAGNGSVWATDNPGFAGSGFRFNDEFWFDVTGPLKRWDGTNWATLNVGPEFMEFIEPGPFGDALNSVSITRATAFAPGYLISQAGTRGSIHTHFVFLLRATNGVAPAVGAYSFPLTLRSPQYGSAPPVHLVFNNGLEEAHFNTAVEHFRAAQEMRLSLERGSNGTVSLSLFTIEGQTNQLLSAPTPGGAWNEHGPAFVGSGGHHKQSMLTEGTNTFFRLRTP